MSNISQIEKRSRRAEFLAFAALLAFWVQAYPGPTENATYWLWLAVFAALLLLAIYVVVGQFLKRWFS